MADPSLGTNPPIKAEIASSIRVSWRDTGSDLRLDWWAGTETRLILGAYLSEGGADGGCFYAMASME